MAGGAGAWVHVLHLPLRATWPGTCDLASVRLDVLIGKMGENYYLPQRIGGRME